jgi:hypothetical protein
VLKRAAVTSSTICPSLDGKWPMRYLSPDALRGLWLLNTSSQRPPDDNGGAPV